MFLEFALDAALSLEPHATDAWAMFDAVNASLLLPDDREVRIDYIGYNTTGFPYLTDDLIHVWDNDNNHYLFEIEDTK